MSLSAFLLLAAALWPARALDAGAPVRLPAPAPARIAFLRNAALGAAPSLAGLDPLSPDFAQAVAPLAAVLPAHATDADLPAAKARAAEAVARLAVQALETGRPEALDAVSGLWEWYGGPADAALARLRDERRRRRVAPLLIAPFGERTGGEEPSTQAPPRPAEGGRLSPPSPPSPAGLSSPPPPPPRKSDLPVRAATASVLVPAIVALIHAGGAAFSAFTLAICALSLLEFAGLMEKSGRGVNKPALLGGGMALAASAALGLPVVPALAGSAALAGAAEIWARRPSLERAAAAVFGAALFGLLPAHLALLRALTPHGAALTLAAFGAAWCSDTAAYLFGRRFGRRKIAPRVSPNKTWEGAFAGLAAAVLLPAGLAALWPAWLPPAAALKIGLVMGTLGQLGGYVNSMIKRANGAKDSGKLFPGHGGAIDRFDSFLLSAALLYYLLRP